MGSEREGAVRERETVNDWGSERGIERVKEVVDQRERGSGSERKR